MHVPIQRSIRRIGRIPREPLSESLEASLVRSLLKQNAFNWIHIEIYINKCDITQMMEKTLDEKVLGSRLREERKRLGLTQDGLARVAGVRRVTVYLYEKGDRQAPLDFLLKMEEAGASLSYLLRGERELEAPMDRQVDSGLVSEIFRLVDEYAVDAKGRPLHPSYRAALFDDLVAMATNIASNQVDRKAIQRKLEAFAA